MISLPGYELNRQIHDGKRSAIYRGHRQRDHQPIIIKTTKNPYPSLAETLRIQNEYAMLTNLASTGIVRAYKLDMQAHRPVLIMEDFGGSSLKHWLRDGDIALAELISLLSKISAIIDDLHQQRVIHKDINPANIVWNRQTGQVKLIDFGISTSAAKEITQTRPPENIEGTIAYIAPEQTGRMNRIVDFRSDLYSLGVSFYELLTGRLPFTDKDTAALVHSHLAKKPSAPERVKPHIPQMLSDIVMKLMEKDADARYQTAYGLKTDLAYCNEKFQANGYIPDFQIGASDTPDYFRLPQKLYGRRGDLAALSGAFDQVSRGRRKLFLISGFAGIGKSALIREAARPMIDRGGLFISGKFEQFKGDIPYAPVISAFKKLILQILTESSEVISHWRQRLIDALEPNAGVIAEVIPEISLIIGQPEKVPELPPVEARNRFHMVLQNFVGVFAGVEHPLILFLDDLQWADLPSLNLLELLMSGPVEKHLLIIGAFREGEVDNGHPLRLGIDNIKAQGADVETRRLEPLSAEDVNELVAETLKADAEHISILSELCLAKTRGNPFFLNQFLFLLYEEGIIAFDSQKRSWNWDLSAIERIRVTDNVVDFMIAKVERLPAATIELLKTAACIGSKFRLDILSRINQMQPNDVDAQLWHPQMEGLILPETGGDSADNPAETPAAVAYNFAHDRIHQAVYSLLDAAEKKRLHSSIGRIMIDEAEASDAADLNLFEAVNHLNNGAGLIADDADRLELAELNSRAGKKAKLSAAYESAYHYVKAAITYLPAGSWKSHYGFTVALYIEAAECAYLTSDFVNMDFFSESTLRHASRKLDKVRIYHLRVQAHIAQNQLMDAIRTDLHALRLLGIRLPLRPGLLDVMAGLLTTKLRLKGKQDKAIVARPTMVAPEQSAAMKLLLAASSPAFFAVPELLPLLAFKQIRLSLKYGNAMETPVAFSIYGLIECGLVNNVESGYQYGKLALELMQRLEAREYETKIRVIFNSQIRHWKDHARQTLQPLLDSYHKGLATGDLEYAAYAVHVHCCNAFCIGMNLSGLEQAMVSYSDAIRRLSQKTAHNFQQIWHQSLLNLKNGGPRKHELIGDIYDETRMLDRHIKANDRTAVFDVYLHKLMLCYMFGRFEEAVEHAAIAEKYADGVTGMLYVPMLHFFASLAKLSLCRQMGTSKGARRVLRQVRRHMKKLKRWAAHCPENYQHKYQLVAAELAAVEGREKEARGLYKKAIESAADNEYPNEQAIANECFGRFWLDQDEPVLARHYMTTARFQYQLWGAEAKVQELTKRYANLLDHLTSDIEASSGVLTTTAKLTSDSLDSVSVLKASQAISGEIRLESLLKKMMTLIIENAGAETGILLLKREADFFVEAEAQKHQSDVHILQGQPIGEVDLPKSIIRFVERTHETVVLDNAAAAEQFAHDGYIIRHEPRSVLCMPIVHQKYLVGILYAENNLIQGAFTRQRLESLNLIASQAAISLENALLYDDLRRAESKLRTLIKTAKEGFVELDNSAVVTDVNPEMSAIIGMSRQELIGLNILSTVDPGNADVFRKELSQRREGKRTGYEVTFVRPDGTPVHCLVKATPMFEDKQVVGSFAMVTDITERKQAEAQIRELNEQLEARVRERTAELERSLTNLKEAQKKLVESEKMASLGGLVAGVAHEVNTPVGVAVTAASFLQEKTAEIVNDHPGLSESSETVRKYLETARDSTALILTNLQRAADLVKSFKQVAVDQSVENKRRFNVNSYIHEILLSMRPRYKHTRHHISIDCPEDMEINSFPGAFAQIVTNLMMNSLVHGFDGIEAGEIRMGFQAADHGILFSYEDDGKGMPPDVLHRVYDPFFTTQRAHGGTGLGMHVVYNLVTQTMSGSIECRSAPGKGVTFEIFIPDMPSANPTG